MRRYQFLMNPPPDADTGTGGANKTPPPAADPKDAEIAALKAQMAEEAAAKTKAEADFEAYKKEQAREKMSEQQKLQADKDAAEKRAAQFEKDKDKAEKKAAKATFGAELVGLGLKPVFVDTAFGQRKGDEDAGTLAARLKAHSDFKDLFGTAARSVPAAPAVPGGPQPKAGKRPPDEDEDERAFLAAFPKQSAAREAAKKRLAEQRAIPTKKSKRA